MEGMFWDCEHVNEAPIVCPCSNTCYCRANTCKTQGKTRGIVPEWAGSEDFGGSDYDTGFETGWDRMMREQMADQDKEKEQAEYLTNSYTQPAPVVNELPYVKDLVLTDIAERAEFGKTKYGTYLQPGNGRDALKDLYQEQLDALMYTRLLIFQRDGK